MNYTFDQELFSDVHKDALGFRPTADHEFYSADSDKKQRLWDDMLALAELMADY